MYVNDTNNNEQLSYQELRDNNPNVSLPKNGTPVILVIWFYVYATAKPGYDPLTQEIVAGVPAKTDDQYFQTWNVVALSPSEIDDNQAQKDLSVQEDMQTQGKALTLDDDARLSVGSPAIIPDRPAHDAWMQSVYAGNIAKPPPEERQHLSITGEAANSFTFTRFHDQWGYRWRMDITREEANNLALYIQNSNGNYLYTTGALIPNGEGHYYAECPAGQADATPEDVFFHWILGAGRISSDFVYKGSDEAMSGVVRSDEQYD